MSLVLELFQIITLKRKPQDLSYDQVAAILSFVSLITMGFFINGMMSAYSQPLGYAIVHSSTQAVVVYGLLRWNNKSLRFVQTITALFGTTVILQMLSLIALQSSLFAATSLLLSMWNIYLVIIILRTALDCTTLVSIAYTIIGYHLVSMLVLILIYPNFPAEITAFLANSGQST